jgi:hypothetical protein
LLDIYHLSERIVDIRCNVKLTFSGVYTVCDNAYRITESVKLGTKVSAKRTCTRSSVMECIGVVLGTWIEDHDQCHVPVSMLLVQLKFIGCFHSIAY